MQCILEFPSACGITTGTPVRVRFFTCCHIVQRCHSHHTILVQVPVLNLTIRGVTDDKNSRPPVKADVRRARRQHAQCGAQLSSGLFVSTFLPQCRFCACSSAARSAWSQPRAGGCGGGDQRCQRRSFVSRGCSHSSHLCFCTQIRGVPVGSTLSVQPSLERVDVYVEMKEPSTVIPRNALIEANQSGLIAEPLIDITPQTPIPNWKVGCYASHGRLRGRHHDADTCV